MPQPEIILGSHWRQVCRESGFFPDDLPHDWCLSYYSNEFRGLCVAASELLNLEDPQEWLEDIPENFLFWFILGEEELNLFNSVDHLAESIRPFSEYLGGLSLKTADENNWYERLAGRLNLAETKKQNIFFVNALADSNREVRVQLEKIISAHSDNEVVLLCVDDFDAQWSRMLEAQVIADLL